VLGYFVYAEEDRSGDTAKKLTAQQMELLDFSQYPIVQRFDKPTDSVPLRAMSSVGLSLPEFVDAATSGGYVSFVPEVDGVVRWVPMVMQLGDYLLPPLSLQMLREATQLPLAVRIAPFEVDGLKLGDNVFPTSESVDFLINYYGPAFTFTHYTASEVLDGKIGEKELENKIILVGGTAVGIHDTHVALRSALPRCGGAYQHHRKYDSAGFYCASGLVTHSGFFDDPRFWHSAGDSFYLL
jgi:adenylate cyclase